MSPPPEPTILIDALNLAYWCGRPPSLRIPVSLLTHLLSQGYAARLYFDASAGHQLEHERDAYERLLLQPQWCVVAPSGRTADGVMLREARASGACIVSRDGFRDYRRKYRKLIDDPARVLSGAVAQDRVLVPGLGIEAPLRPSASAGIFP